MSDVLRTMSNKEQSIRNIVHCVGGKTHTHTKFFLGRLRWRTEPETSIYLEGEVTSSMKIYEFSGTLIYFSHLNSDVNCFQNCSDLLGEKNVLEIEKSLRLKTIICEIFENDGPIYSNSTSQSNF